MPIGPDTDRDGNPKTGDPFIQYPNRYGDPTTAGPEIPYGRDVDNPNIETHRADHSWSNKDKSMRIGGLAGHRSEMPMSRYQQIRDVASIAGPYAGNIAGNIDTSAYPTKTSSGTDIPKEDILKWAHMEKETEPLDVDMDMEDTAKYVALQDRVDASSDRMDAIDARKGDASSQEEYNAIRADWHKEYDTEFKPPAKETTWLDDDGRLTLGANREGYTDLHDMRVSQAQWSLGNTSSYPITEPIPDNWTAKDITEEHSIKKDRLGHALTRLQNVGSLTHTPMADDTFWQASSGRNEPKTPELDESLQTWDEYLKYKGEQTPPEKKTTGLFGETKPHEADLESDWTTASDLLHDEALMKRAKDSFYH